MRSLLFLIAAVIPLAYALDCRKFSFAPACRGIMLKRSEAAEVESPLDLDQLAQNLEALSWVLRLAEAEGIKDCVPISWIKHKLTLSSWSPTRP
ncbi:hypothetical protein TELCIR_11331 [Teladorsagia circumcincta]|uniref:Uncharacterized protein n=1 Tax=Teladorsagia circumcincta TaxID=45464 RepID=A0A2G9U9P2_TELCI|nr:hypothetical protein TELCIR_11331 [Teladorsagia circumcincta]